MANKVNPQIVNDQVTATSDAAGNITFAFPPAPMTGQVKHGTVSIAGVPNYATFSATTLPGNRSFGTWQGTQPFGPVETRDLDKLVVTGINVLPLTKYVATWAGAQEDAITVAPQYPNVLPAAPTFNRAPLWDGSFQPSPSAFAIPPLAPIAPGSTVCDVSDFPGVRVALANTDTTHAVMVLVTFYARDNASVTGQREILLANGSGGGTGGMLADTATFQMPVLGERMSVQAFSAPAGSTINALQVRVYGANNAESAWGNFAGGRNNGINNDVLAITGSHTMAFATTITYASTFLYAGPASLQLSWVTVPSAWNATVSIMTESGTAAIVAGVDQASAPGTNPRSGTFYLPAAPVLVSITNGAGSGSNIMQGSMLNGDTWRAG